MAKKNFTYFQDEWLDGDTFSKWVMKTHLKTHSRCSIWEILIYQQCELLHYWVMLVEKNKDKLTSLSKDCGIASIFHVPKVKKVSQEYPVHQNQLTQSNLHKV